MKKVAVIMGSDSDLPVLESCFQTLRKLNIPYETHVYSAHRTPDAAGAFAASARENGFTHFTTTLLISPYQNHELLARTAREAGEKFGVAFLYRDFRPFFREGQDRARAMGLYMPVSYTHLPSRSEHSMAACAAPPRHRLISAVLPPMSRLR